MAIFDEIQAGIEQVAERAGPSVVGIGTGGGPGRASCSATARS